MRLMKNLAGSVSVKPASTIPSDPLLSAAFSEARNEATEAIAAKGRERGFVTSDDVLGGLPELQLAPEQIEEFLAHVEQALRDEGIEVIDLPGDDPEEGFETGRSRRQREDLLKAPAFDPVRMYLKEIGRVPLLTAAQEVDLAMRIEAGALAVDLLASIAISGRLDRHRFQAVVDSVIRIREHQLDPVKCLRFEGIGRETLRRGHRPRGRMQAVDLLHRVAQDADVAKRKLIEANLRLVVSIAKHYATYGITFLDLTQEGNLGLIRAVEKFDYTRGYKFSTYATWWIRQAISRAIADQSRVIRIPVHMTEHINKVGRAQRELTQTLGREPTAEEVGRRVGLSGERVDEVRSMSRDPLSLETPVGEEDDARLGEFIEDHGAIAPLEAASFGMMQDEIVSVLRTLSARERRVVELRFGLMDGQPRTLEEVGREFGITRERIRQIESKTLSKLRHPSRAQRLRDYLEERD
ncbi:MAG TPA: RNA polymerase sigma factor RpoD [Actinomycetota bacterium]|jgi:RNA polymerase primary sigma factor